MLSSAEFDPLRQVILNERITTESDRHMQVWRKLPGMKMKLFLSKHRFSTPHSRLDGLLLPGLESFSSTEKKRKFCKRITFFAA